jgi:hypothetical protein
MSALGYERTFAPQKAISALLPKADMHGATGELFATVFVAPPQARCLAPRLNAEEFASLQEVGNRPMQRTIPDNHRNRLVEVCPAILNGHILMFAVSSLRQAPPEFRYLELRFYRRTTAEEPDHRGRWLLHAGCQRPRDR